MVPSLASPASSGSVSGGATWWGEAAISRVADGLTLWRRLGLLLALLWLPLLVSSCGGPGQPPRAVLLNALALQIQLTQGAIAQALELDAPGLPQVSRVRVEEQRPLPLADGQGLLVRGRFDWRLAHDPIRVDSPFELVLQRGERGQSWRLARPLPQAPGISAAERQWTTYPLPLPGERKAS